jgi:hypothetical protein
MRSCSDRKHGPPGFQRHIGVMIADQESS